MKIAANLFSCCMLLHVIISPTKAQLAGIGNLGNLNAGGLGNLVGVTNLVSNIGNVGNLGNVANVANLGNFGNIGNLANLGNLGNLISVGNLNGLDLGNLGNILNNLGNIGNFPILSLLQNLGLLSGLLTEIENLTFLNNIQQLNGLSGLAPILSGTTFLQNLNIGNVVSSNGFNSISLAQLNTLQNALTFNDVPIDLNLGGLNTTLPLSEFHSLTNLTQLGVIQDLLNCLSLTVNDLASLAILGGITSFLPMPLSSNNITQNLGALNMTNFAQVLNIANLGDLNSFLYTDMNVTCATLGVVANIFEATLTPYTVRPIMVILDAFDEDVLLLRQPPFNNLPPGVTSVLYNSLPATTPILEYVADGGLLTFLIRLIYVLTFGKVCL